MKYEWEIPSNKSNSEYPDMYISVHFFTCGPGYVYVLD